MRRIGSAVRLLLVLVLALAVASSGSTLVAQEVELAARGPRFLVAPSSARAAPIEIDAGSNALLRRVVSLRLDRPTVGRVLEAIEQQTGVRIFFNPARVGTDRAVTLRAESITVAAALTEVLLGTRLDVLISQRNQVALVERAGGVVTPPTGTIVGRVTDGKTQAALAGATVAVEGTSRSATTGNDGRYRVANMAPGTYTLRARYIGYAPGTASVTLGADQEATADFTLEKSAQRLDEVVTTGTIVPTEVKALPTPISIITSEDLERENIERVDQLFRGDVPGAIAWDLGPLDYSSVIQVRGGSSLNSAGIKTYVDGIELSNTYEVATLDPKSIERIEITRGPQASTLYGAGALNGVMQIFTKRGSESRRPTISLMLSGGPLETRWGPTGAVAQQDYALSLSGGTRDYSYTLGGAHGSTGEWVDQFFLDKNSLYSSIQGTQGPLTVTLTARYVTDHRGFPLYPILQPYPILYTNHDEQRETGTTYGMTLGFRATPDWQHHLTLGYDALEQRIMYNPYGLVPLFQRFTNESSKPSIAYNTTFDLRVSQNVTANLTAGIDHFAYHGTVSQISSQDKDNSVGVTLLLSEHNDYTNSGYFLQTMVGIRDAVFFTAGLRADQSSTFGVDYGLAWAPRVGASYIQQLGGLTLKARVSFGKGIRAPAPSERLASLSGTDQTLANPNLGPEVQVGGDAGIDVFFGKRVSLGVTVYKQRAEDLIDAVVLDETTNPRTLQFQNIGTIRNRGVELEATAALLRSLTLTGTFSVASSKVQTLSPTYTGAYLPGDQLLSVPTRSAGGALTYATGRSTATIGVTYIGSWTAYNNSDLYAFAFGGAPFRGSLRAYWRRYPAFAKLRLGASHELGRGFTGFLNIENLTNNASAEYDDYTVTPGRTSVFGIRARW